MVASYAVSWKQNCTTTDMRFIALEVRRWFLRPRIVILYPGSLDTSMLMEAMEQMQKSMMIPEHMFLNKEDRETLKDLGSSGTTALVSFQK